MSAVRFLIVAEEFALLALLFLFFAELIWLFNDGSELYPPPQLPPLLEELW